MHKCLYLYAAHEAIREGDKLIISFSVLLLLLLISRQHITFHLGGRGGQWSGAHSLRGYNLSPLPLSTSVTQSVRGGLDKTGLKCERVELPSPFGDNVLLYERLAYLLDCQLSSTPFLASYLFTSFNSHTGGVCKIVSLCVWKSPSHHQSIFCKQPHLLY